MGRRVDNVVKIDAIPERLVVEALARTEWFVDPSGAREPKLDAPAFVFDAAGDYTLSARVTVEFADDFDAGALVLLVDDALWAKLCFEYSPQREPMIVFVVTRGRSDDANGFVVEGNSVWLRIARIGSAFAFHASVDGSLWQLVRHFTLTDGAEPLIGFEAQSPTGDGCTVTFEAIRFQASRLAELRDGS